MELDRLLQFFAEAIRSIDKSGKPHKNFLPGVGPYGEPQLLGGIAAYLKENHPDQFGEIGTKRKPDILIPGMWAIECKIVRPFGDNDMEAEHWSQNLLHPYKGNTSSIGDIYKLLELETRERKAVIAITFEHSQPKISISTIVTAFEKIALDVLQLPLGTRYEVLITDLIHPVHGQSRLFGWEISPAAK